MCLISDTPASTIADKDIECFKFYYSSKPKINIGNIEIKPYIISPYIGSKVYSIPCYLDDYGNNPDVLNSIQKCRKDNIFKYIIEKGYIHSCSKIECLTHYDGFLALNTVIVKCKIPKGSEYFISSDNESLCSKELILEKIVYPNERKEFHAPLPLFDLYKTVYDYETMAKFENS